MLLESRYCATKTNWKNGSYENTKYLARERAIVGNFLIQEWDLQLRSYLLHITSQVNEHFKTF